MCGIYGWDLSSINISDDQRGLLGIALARSNDQRGGHSWGALADLADVYKGLGDIEPVSLDLAKFKRLAAHTRWATHGDRTVDNAHPFTLTGRTGEVVGAHNGVIYNHASLNYKHKRSFEVDSMHIFQAIADGTNLDDLEGYGTIWWRMDGELYLCRMNDAGDLAVYGLDDPHDPAAHGVVFSSDGAHLVSALRDADLYSIASAYHVEPGVVYSVSDQLYRTKMTLTLERGRQTLRWSDFRFDTEDASSYGSSQTRGAMTDLRSLSSYDFDDDVIDDLTPLDADKIYDFDSCGNLVGVYVIDPDTDAKFAQYSSLVSDAEQVYRVYVTTVESEQMIQCAIQERWGLDEILDAANTYGELCDPA